MSTFHRKKSFGQRRISIEPESETAFSFKKIFGFIVFGLALFVLLSFFGIWKHFHFEDANAKKFWSEDGAFSYSGSFLSSLSGSEIAFTNKNAIKGIKTLYTEKSVEPRLYIEYPDFVETQNISMISAVREKITELKSLEPKNEKDAKYTYNAFFETKGSPQAGSLVYTIEMRDTKGKLQSSHKQTFVPSNAGKIWKTSELVDISNIEDVDSFTQVLEKEFTNAFPQKQMLAHDVVKNNVIKYLQNPTFAFSDNNIIFYINSGVFSDNDASDIELNLPYSHVKNVILTAVKPPQKPSNPSKKEDSYPKASDGKKYVALTFDDGPHGAYTPKLLDTLVQKNVHASFYVLGKNVAGHEQILQRMVSEGHEVGSHSWSHTLFTKLSVQAIRNEIDKTSAAVQQAIGKSPTTFRPPYGGYNPQVLKTVSLPFIMWSVDSLDWKHRNVQKNMQTTLSQVHDGAIILYHDIHKQSVDTIPGLIDELRARGYEFLTVSELYQKYYNRGDLLPEQVCFSMRRCE